MKKHLLELAQKDEHTRRRFVRWLDLALSVSETLLILRAFAAMPANNVSVSMLQALMPFVILTMVVLMMNYIEKLSTKLRQQLKVGFQAERPLVVLTTGPNLIAMFSITAIRAGVLPSWLIGFSTIGVILVAAIACVLYIAVEDETISGGVNYNETIAQRT